VSLIEKSLQYLAESLSNYTESDIVSQQIMQKLDRKTYKTVIDFIEDLNDGEKEYLNTLLKQDIRYAQNTQDYIRLNELNDIYEQLF